MQVDKVYNEDALKGLKDIPDNSIDLVVTDPPIIYNPVGIAAIAVV